MIHLTSLSDSLQLFCCLLIGLACLALLLRDAFVQYLYNILRFVSYYTTNEFASRRLPIVQLTYGIKLTRL